MGWDGMDIRTGNRNAMIADMDNGYQSRASESLPFSIALLCSTDSI